MGIVRASDDSCNNAVIPVEIGNLTSLEHLLPGHNQLSGTIPAEIGNLTSLTSLDLEDNQLSGTIPAEIGNLSLTVLGLKDNQLSGTIPAELGNLTHLANLSVDIDTGLCLAPDFDLTSPFATATGLPVCSGTPTPTDPADDRAALEALYDATNGANWSSNDNWKTDEPLGQWFGVRINNSDGRVTRLDLNYNQLSGTIPAELGNLSSLTELELGGNQLSGTIPVELGNLTRLTTLDLNYNQLSGNSRRTREPDPPDHPEARRQPVERHDSRRTREPDQPDMAGARRQPVERHDSRRTREPDQPDMAGARRQPVERYDSRRTREPDPPV